VQDLATRVGVDKLAPFDEILAALAATANPADVAKACERIAAHLDPDGPDPDPDGAFDRRDLTLSKQGSMLYLRGRLDPEGAATLRAALEALMRPPADGDLRTAGQRRADALVDLARLPLNTGQLRRRPAQPRHPHHPLHPDRPPPQRPNRRRHRRRHRRARPRRHGCHGHRRADRRRGSGR
jgi:hypothetical protein